MPTITVRYSLPDEQADYDAARLGRAMSACLSEIDQRCRTVCKHEQEPSEAELADARAVERLGQVAAERAAAHEQHARPPELRLETAPNRAAALLRPGLCQVARR